MKNKKIFIVVALLIAVLLLGIGYAMSNKTLTISGKATATPNDNNFVVRFATTPDPSVSDETKVTATRTDDKTATLNVTGLTAKGDTVTATYTIENASPDLSADLVAEVSQNTNKDYFKVTTAFAKETITKGETTTITVTVELLKTPVTGDVSSDITVTLTASPVQPS